MLCFLNSIVLYFNIGMKKTKGFTLIEVIVGIIIIAVTSLGAFEFFRYCRYFIVSAELRLSAANFARETMEGHSWDIEHSWWTDGKEEGWQDEFLPEEGTFASRLADEYSGERDYRFRRDNPGEPPDPTKAADDYNIINVRVSWEYLIHEE